jgi:plasmid stabilization system protein ParE
MIHYTIIIEGRVWSDSEAIVRRIARDNPDAAAKWFRNLVKKIDSLESMPERHPIAPESDDFPEEIREAFLGKRQNKYRILFAIRGDTVHVLHVRHGAREPLRPDNETEQRA